MSRSWSFVLGAFAVGAIAGAAVVAALALWGAYGGMGLAGASRATPPAGVGAVAGQGPERDPSATILEPRAESGTPTPQTTPPDPMLVRLDELGAAWTRIDDEVTRLRRRITDLEQRLSSVQARSVAAEASAPARLGATPDGQKSAMVRAGLAEDTAAEIIRRQGQQALDRLNLRDVATREGWLGSDRYREELARLEEEAVDLRQELGDEVYDRYLYAVGEDNRVRVDGIIAGSAGEAAGLQPGDLIEAYAGEPVLTVSDLREATGGGERGELVQVRVRRGAQTFDAWVARGPLGVQLDTARAEPR